MTESKPGRRADRKPVPWYRVALWMLTAAVGAYLVLTGIIGILAKG